MPEIPSGTVTFLFTDIEGSTRLLKELRARYRDVVADHHRLLRAAFQAAGGHEIGTEGDAFYAAFPRATDALMGAVEAQRALAAHSWPHGAKIRVRMGIHTGEALVGEEGYVGLALHRVARITSSAHGGQIVVSHATRDLVEDELPDDIRLRNLGEHRLKDFERPESIFQVETDDLPGEFPALRTLDGQSDYAARFAGREEELTDAARAAIQQPRSLRRRSLLLAALAGVLAAAVSIPVFALGRGDSGEGYGVRKGSNALVVIDPATNEVLGAVSVGSRPGDVVYDSGALWVANLDDETVSRINPKTQEVERTIATREAPHGLAADGRHGVWFVSASPNSSVAKVGRIAAEYNTVDDKPIEVPGYPFGGVTGDIAAAEGVVWIVPGGVGHVSRIDPDTTAVTETMDAGSCCPSSIAVGAGGVWVADSYADRVIRLGAGGIVTPIPVGDAPSGIAAEPGAVWVALAGEGKVARIEPTTQSYTTIPVGRAPDGVAVGGGAVWVANSRDGTVSRIDPVKNEVVTTIEVGENPHGIVFAAGKVWVTVQKRAVAPLERSAERRQTARFTASRDPDSLDPALAYARPGNPAPTRATLSWQIEYATCLKLVNYADSPEAKLVPDAVVSMPQRSRDGRTYTFTIRNGIRFSPPSNQPVTAKTFKYAIERSLSPRMGGPARPAAVMAGTGSRSTVEDIVGAEAYAAGNARQISGITARGNRLRIRLTRPAPDFPERLALPFFCAVPIGTPITPKGVTTVPSAGPYYVASYTRGQAIVLRRNPNYTGSRPHHFAEMRIALGVAAVESVRQITSGQSDYALDGVPTFEHAALNARYGKRSSAASNGRQRYFVNPGPELFYLSLNPSRGPFADARLRRAANYAVDRRELIRIAESVFLAEPTDQYLPPGLRGFRDAAVYPSTADPTSARRLVGNRRVKAVLYVCAFLCLPLGQAVKARLGAVGIDVEISEFSLTELRKRLGTKGEPFDFTISAWNADTIDPMRYLRALFDGRRIREKDNLSYFNDPAYNRALDAAAKLSGRARDLAYARLDADLARNAAPNVALAVTTRQDFFSARMGCQVYNPIYGMSLAALCVRRSK